jgi:hypothetical protein
MYFLAYLHLLKKDMKAGLLCFFMISASVSLAQTMATARLELDTRDCRGNSSWSKMRKDSILFFKLPEDTLAFKIFPIRYDSSKIRLDNIPASDYRLHYRNMYGQPVIRHIDLATGRVNKIELCPDSLESYPQNTLSKLRNHESISINMLYMACFEMDCKHLIITRINDSLIARLYEISYNDVIKHLKSGKSYKPRSLISETVLTPKNIQDFIRFENELNFINEEGTSTVVIYEVTSKYLKIKTTDSERWSGFRFLRRSFFGDNGLLIYLE